MKKVLLGLCLLVLFGCGVKSNAPNIPPGALNIGRISYVHVLGDYVFEGRGEEKRKTARA